MKKICNLFVLLLPALVVTGLLGLLPTFVTARQAMAEALNAGVAIEPNSSDAGDPGHVLTYTHTITNAGNATDTFTITVSNSDDGFLAVSSLTTVTLTATDSAEVFIYVAIPVTATGGLTNTTTVRATSDTDPLMGDTVVNTTTVNTLSGVIIEPDRSEAANPGQTVVYNHTVTNTSNKTDTYTVTAVSSAGFPYNLSAETLTIARDISATLQVTVTVPQIVASGITDTLTVTVTSQNDSGVSDRVVDRTTAGMHTLFLPVIVSPSVWESVGEVSWPVEASDKVSAVALAVCATDSSLMFAGTSDKLLRWSGTGWVNISEPSIPTGYAVSDNVFNTACDKVYASFSGAGVWQGQQNGGSWDWTSLTGGLAPDQVREIVLVEESGQTATLFAGGEFGIYYWQMTGGAGWQDTNGPGSTGQPIMHLSIANPQTNTGPIYAVQWNVATVFHNPTPSTTPASWTAVPNIPNVPESTMRYVSGDDGGVRIVGTSDHHYEWLNNAWQTARAVSARSSETYGNKTYVGYGDNTGVFVSTGDGQYSSMNNGWSAIPKTIFGLVAQGQSLYAATSDGVWVYRLSN